MDTEPQYEKAKQCLSDYRIKTELIDHCTVTPVYSNYEYQWFEAFDAYSC